MLASGGLPVSSRVLVMGSRSFRHPPAMGSVYLFSIGNN